MHEVPTGHRLVLDFETTFRYDKAHKIFDNDDDNDDVSKHQKVDKRYDNDKGGENRRTSVKEPLRAFSFVFWLIFRVKTSFFFCFFQATLFLFIVLRTGI